MDHTINIQVFSPRFTCTEEECKTAAKVLEMLRKVTNKETNQAIDKVQSILIAYADVAKYNE